MLWKEAFETLDYALKLEPDEPRIWNIKGVFHFQIDEIAKSIKCFDKAIKLDPQYAIPWLNKGVCLAESDKNDEAMTLVNHSIRLKPDVSFAWFIKGTISEELNDYENALVSFNKALDLSPNQLAVLKRKANLLFTIERFEEAISIYELILKLDEKDEIIWQNMGWSYDRSGKQEEAIIAYNKALELDPSCANTINNKGAAFDELGRYEEAISTFEEAIEADNSFSYPWNNKGISLYKLGRYDEALLALENALGIDPDFSEAIYFKILINYIQGNINLANNLLNKLLASNPEHLALNRTGNILTVKLPCPCYDLNNVTSVFNSVKKALQSSSDDLNFVGYFYHNDIYCGSLENLLYTIHRLNLAHEISNGKVGLNIVFLDFETVFLKLDFDENNIIILADDAGNPFLVKQIIYSFSDSLRISPRILNLYDLALVNIVEPELDKQLILIHNRGSFFNMLTAESASGVLEMLNLHMAPKERLNDHFIHSLTKQDFENVNDTIEVFMFLSNEKQSLTDVRFIGLSDLFNSIHVYRGIHTGRIKDMLILKIMLYSLYIELDGKRVFEVSKNTTFPMKKSELVEYTANSNLLFEVITDFNNHELVIFSNTLTPDKNRVKYATTNQMGLTVFTSEIMLDIDANRLTSLFFDKQLFYSEVF